MKNWIVVGATSAIAESVCRIWAARGYSLFLVARNQEKLDTITADLKIRGAEAVYSFVMDANDFEAHERCLIQARESMGKVSGVFIAHGTLPNQKGCEDSYGHALKEIETNALSVISLCTISANYLEEQGQGDIAVISSVAGDRGRQSNYVYGAAKGMVSIYLQGLRNRLASKGVHVTTIKPGFVDTPMTAEIEKGGPLWASTETVAKGIVKSIDKKRNVSYLPWFWLGIMAIIKNIPEFVFKKLSL